jgi:hypothetical protein
VSHPTQTYTDSDRALALTAIIGNLGNVAKTSREIGIPERTLHNWKKEYPDQYDALEKKYAQQIEEEIVQRARQNAREAGMVVEGAIDRAKKVLADTKQWISPGELAKIARDMSQVHAQNMDKVLTLTGRPTAITESRELVALVRSLEADGVLKVVEGTAEEITDGG